MFVRRHTTHIYTFWARWAPYLEIGISDKFCWYKHKVIHTTDKMSCFTGSVMVIFRAPNKQSTFRRLFLQDHIKFYIHVVTISRVTDLSKQHHPRSNATECSIWSRSRWLSWMRRPTGDQEVAGSTPAEVGNILSWRLIMKYFLRSFSPFRWFKKGSCQFLAKECAQYWLTA